MRAAVPLLAALAALHLHSTRAVDAAGATVTAYLPKSNMIVPPALNGQLEVKFDQELVLKEQGQVLLQEPVEDSQTVYQLTVHDGTLYVKGGTVLVLDINKFRLKYKDVPTCLFPNDTRVQIVIGSDVLESFKGNEVTNPWYLIVRGSCHEPSGTAIVFLLVATALGYLILILHMCLVPCIMRAKRGDVGAMHSPLVPNEHHIGLVGQSQQSQIPDNSLDGAGDEEYDIEVHVGATTLHSTVPREQEMSELREDQ